MRLPVLPNRPTTYEPIQLAKQSRHRDRRHRGSRWRDGVGIGASGGSIINISSMTAQKPLTRVLGYGNAKAAVDNFPFHLAPTPPVPFFTNALTSAWPGVIILGVLQLLVVRGVQDERNGCPRFFGDSAAVAIGRTPHSRLRRRHRHGRYGSGCAHRLFRPQADVPQHLAARQCWRANRLSARSAATHCRTNAGTRRTLHATRDAPEPV